MKVHELVALGSLDPRRLCGSGDLLWSLVAVREPPIQLWVVPRIVVVKAPDSALKVFDS